MAKNHCFDPSGTALVFIAVFALLGSALACQSEAADEPDGEAAAGPEPDAVRVRPRDDDGATPEAPLAMRPESPESPASSEAASSPNAAEPVSADSSPPAAAQTFAACTSSERTYATSCDTIYVTMKQTSPSRCVQLNIDNCGGYNQQGLRVDVPLSWRLASGTIVSNFDECELGVFYPNSDVIVDASGSISWNEATQLPSELVLELTLEPSTSAADTASVEVVTAEPLNPSACASD